MSKPAHKQDDPNKAPGQIKYEKKLTFEEWWDSQKDLNILLDDYNLMEKVWKAAQENK